MPSTAPKRDRKPPAAPAAKPRPAARRTRKARPEPPPPAAEAHPWTESASFLVYIERKVHNGVEECRTVARRRTAVHHMETGESRTWPGVALEACARWMHDHLPAPRHGAVEADAPSPAPAPQALSIAETPAAARPPAAVPAPPRAFEEVRLVQGSVGPPRLLFKNGKRHASWLEAQRPWSLEFALGLPGALPPVGPHRLAVQALRHGGHEPVALGTVVVPAPAAGARASAEVALPAGALAQGAYAIECRLEDDSRTLARLRLPLLEVCAATLPRPFEAADIGPYAPGKRGPSRRASRAS